MCFVLIIINVMIILIFISISISIFIVAVLLIIFILINSLSYVKTDTFLNLQLIFLYVLSVLYRQGSIQFKNININMIYYI